MKTILCAAVLCAVLNFAGPSFADTCARPHHKIVHHKVVHHDQIMHHAASSKNSALMNTVRDAQIRLDGLGYHTGFYDGKMGPVTASATRNFQRDYGLYSSGKLTPDTYSLLKYRSSALYYDGHYHYPFLYRYAHYYPVYPSHNVTFHPYHIPAYKSSY